MSRDGATGSQAGALRTTMVAAASSAIGTAPAFLVGSLASFTREDFAISPSELGLAVTCFFIASALSVLPGGRLTERIGARRAMLGSAAISGIAALGIALTAHSLSTLILWLALAGSGNGVAQPAGNLAIARGVPPGRLGIAFGIKQSAIPSATLAAGAAVPLLGLTVGWRWAFVAVATGAVVLAIVMPRDASLSAPRTPSKAKVREGDIALRPLLALAFATGCGAAVATSLASFYVESSVDAGVPVGLGGGLLMIGSVAVIMVRMWIGWRVDRTSWDYLLVVTIFLTIGTAGYVGLAMSSSMAILVAATLLAFMAGWGWPGLFNLAVVRLNNNAPAIATSITQSGVFIGGITGPVVFGAIAEAVSFRAAWTFCAILNLGAALAIMAARRMLRTSQIPQRQPRPSGPG